MTSYLHELSRNFCSATCRLFHLRNVFFSHVPVHNGDLLDHNCRDGIVFPIQDLKLWKSGSKPAVVLFEAYPSSTRFRQCR